MQIFSKKNVTKNYNRLQINQKSTNFAASSAAFVKNDKSSGEIKKTLLTPKTQKMARHSTRRVHWMAPIENASTKFALVREKAGINNGGIKYFGARIYNQLDTNGMREVTGFTFRKYGRETQPSAQELSRRENFATGNAWALAAKKDLTSLSTNQQHYMQVRENRRLSCDGVYWEGETFVGYLRKFAIKQLNESKTLPENHALPTPA